MIYSLHIQVEKELCSSWLHYMKEKHIHEVLATGCFTSAEFYQLDEDECSFRVDYQVNQKEELEHYFACYATRLREDHLHHFPNGVEVTRTIWKPISTVRN
jgi:hypothetical protein